MYHFLFLSADSHIGLLFYKTIDFGVLIAPLGIAKQPLAIHMMP
jgi:hypothetical protein